MIVSENIKISLKPPLEPAYIEEEFAKHSINPLRWAITEVSENEFRFLRHKHIPQHHLQKCVYQ